MGAILEDPRASRLAPQLKVRGAWYELARASRADDVDEAQVTASWGMVGRAALGGAEDGILKRDAQPFVGEGTVKDATPRPPRAQAPLLLRPIRRWMQPYRALQWIELGGSDRLTMVSFQARRRPSRPSREAGCLTRDDLDDVVILGLSNAYRGCFTTKEEYALQHYEEVDLVGRGAGRRPRGPRGLPRARRRRGRARKCGLRTTAPRRATTRASSSSTVCITAASRTQDFETQNSKPHARHRGADRPRSRPRRAHLSSRPPGAAVVAARRGPVVSRAACQHRASDRPVHLEPLEIEGLPEDDDRGRTLTS